jgi:hypothetical protein
MNVRQQRTFVYGTFRWPTKVAASPSGLLPPPPLSSPGEPDIALEILREFSSTELIGKIYVRPLYGSWTPAQWDQVQRSVWYAQHERLPKHFVFDMVGSGLWEVLNFRSESEDTGPYVAVALQYLPTTFPWVIAQRRREQVG